MTSESNKQKIAKIHDIFPTATKDQIAKILQYYEDDENKAVDALTRDGGCEALSNWAESGNAKSKNNKNKKKKRKGKKEPGFGSSATASFDADDSSSLHSGGNVDTEIEKDSPTAESSNGILHDAVDDCKSSTHERLNILETESVPKDLAVSNEDIDSRFETNISSVPENSKGSNVEPENPVCASPISDSSDKQEDMSIKRDKYRSVKEEGYGRYSSRQRANSYRRSKTSSFSEDSIGQHSTQTTAAATKRGYERCKKDLNRQTISLQRIHVQVDKGLEESSKKLKSVFNDLRKMLDQRQEQIELELAKAKEDALNLLKSRQDLGVDLKRRVDRTPSLTEAEWSELRSDVKQFVTERKYDDELGKTIWFQWSLDSITESIKTFGEVHPVKNVYSQRSHSALGNVIASHNNPEASPSSSLANEEIGSTGDKNDVANMLDTVEDETPAVKQDTTVPVVRSQPSENRPRIFSNTKFQNNRGRGFNRGNRGYGYSRPNNRNNYRNNNYGHFEYTDYRNPSHQERDGRVHNNAVFSNDRNVNNHRNNRNERRGPSVNYRQNSGRYRSNPSQQRQNSDTVIRNEPVTNENSVDSGKANVMNGFMNNN